MQRALAWDGLQGANRSRVGHPTRICNAAGRPKRGCDAREELVLLFPTPGADCAKAYRDPGVQPPPGSGHVEKRAMAISEKAFQFMKALSELIAILLGKLRKRFHGKPETRCNDRRPVWGQASPDPSAALVLWR